MKHLLLSLIFILPYTLSAQVTDEQIQKILASDGAAGDGFGHSVSISGDYAILGAYYDDDNGSESGSAYIYYKDQGGTGNWGQVKKITASDGAADDYFGQSVSISGNYAIVGADGDDDNGSSSGSAYIYYKDQGGTGNWGQVKKITASDGTASDYFGVSVSLSGNYAIVGASADDDNGSFSGSAYIFYKDQGGTANWGEVKKITASDGAAGDNFGRSVSISANYAIVGSIYDNDNGSSSGSAYIFNKDQGGTGNWGEIKKIIASDGAAADWFGYPVSLSSDYAIIGAHGDDDNGNRSGSAYIFNKDQGGTANWGEIKKIIASDGAADDRFGQSVSISGNYAIVGADGDDDNGNATGSAYIFNNDQGGTANWGEVKKITASDGAADDYFGTWVNLSGNFAIVGADYDDANGTNSGSAYIFGPSMPTVNTQPSGQTNSCGGSVVEYSLAGTDIDNYQWQVSTDGGTSFSNISNGSVYNGVRNDTLTVTVSQSLDDYRYRCKVTNTYYPAPVTNHINRFYSDTVDLTLETQAPTLTPQNDTVYLDAAGQWKLQPSAVVAGASDNCALADTTLSQSIFTGNDVGVVTIDITVNDSSGNSVARQADVFVEDTTGPVLTTHNTKIYLDTAGNAGVDKKDVISAASDNCEIQDTLLNQSSFACSDTGLTTINVTVNDVNGNSNTQTANVTVRDTLKPNVTCPSDQTVDANNSGAYTVQGDEFDLESYEDNCSVTTITNDFNDSQTLADAEIPAGTHDMNWEVIDASGNSQICSFDLKVSEYTGITGLKESDIQVYPNPTDGKLHIHSENLPIERLSLVTLNGSKVIEKTKVNKARPTLDMSELAPGVYILRIQSDKGLFTTKIIFQQ
jgi:hypothetical protein